jgi:hypothetical protein
MSTPRSEALRRLGGPVCPVCDAVGVEVEARWLIGSEQGDWLISRGKGYLDKQGLVPMCGVCFRLMTEYAIAKRASAVEQRARMEAQRAAQEARDLAHLGSLDGGLYRESCVEYDDDLVAAEKIGDTWGLGSGLFGGRSRE